MDKSPGFRRPNGAKIATAQGNALGNKSAVPAPQGGAIPNPGQRLGFRHRDRISTVPQSLSNVLVHLVFSTKNRSPWLTPEVRDELFPYLAGILRNSDCPVLQIGGVEDHVHLLFNLSRTLTMAQAVEKLKVASSKWLKVRWPAMSEFSWQGGYGAFSVGQGDVERVVLYIQSQAEHHRKRSFQDEFRQLCQEQEVALDERYVWD